MLIPDQPMGVGEARRLTGFLTKTVALLDQLLEADAALLEVLAVVEISTKDAEGGEAVSDAMDGIAERIGQVRLERDAMVKARELMAPLTLG